jgi:hypothetical protein
MKIKNPPTSVATNLLSYFKLLTHLSLSGLGRQLGYTVGATAANSEPVR